MRSRRWPVLLLAALGVLAGGAVVVSNLVVVLRTGDQVVREPDAVRPAQVAIVPGSLVRPDGSLGDVVQERLDAAVALHEAGTVEKILVSGDNGDPSYNEPDAMRDAALAAGVPAEDVFTDYAGFSTWHTMRRAREVFEVESAVVVTQGFHTARAVDLGVAAGLEVQGLATDDGSHTARELLARVRGLWEATVEPRVTPGDPLPITGDGRTSWAQ
ncbi:SanA/YdcF family protein [Nocardioides nanhaiensis]|uniref:SanA/YdcF family protein n=1 Tax=Nocardioides nanhaiensis TaxID=1476871 RepID=UPI0031E585F1